MGVTVADRPARTPIGALFEAAFRRFGANVFGYTLWSLAVGVVPAIVGIGLRDSDRALYAFVPAQSFAHFALCGILTALVAGTLRERAAAITVAAAVAAAIVGGVFAVVGPFAIPLYPLLVFAPIAAAAGDAGGLSGLFHGLRLALRDWGRAYGVLLGLGLIAIFLWFAFFLSLTPVGGAAHQVATLILTTVVFSPLAALVERNLYGDATGRRVLPATVSVDQAERRRGGRQRRS